VTTTRRLRGLCAALLLGSCPATAVGQAGTITIVPVQALSFGLLFPGTMEVVRVTDVARRAVVALAGSGSVDVSFVLPTALETEGGLPIPLRFGPTDAGVLTSRSLAPMPINPHDMTRVQLSPDQPVHVLLGGTALAAPDQRQGRYTARVLVLVSQPGT
jgi:hypothetical protein